MTVPVPYVNLRVPFSAFRPASYFAFDQDAPDTPAPLDPARRAAAPPPACKRTSCAPVLVPLYARLIGLHGQRPAGASQELDGVH